MSYNHEQDYSSVNDTGESPGYNAVSPVEELTSKDAWFMWLEETLPEFSGNLEHAAYLMWAFSMGRRYILTRPEYRTQPIKPPMIALLLDDTEEHEMGCIGGEITYIRGSYLAKMSQHHPGDGIRITSINHTISFEGKVIDHFGLAGIEETHHALYIQLHPDVAGNIDPLHVPMSQAEYDVQEMEYQALGWQLKFAKARPLSERTTQILQLRYDAATSIHQ